MARPIEQLEPRLLFAASITPVQVIDGLRTVTLEGDFFSGAADTFTISHDGNDEDLTFSGTINTTRNNVERLRVRGHGGGDTITYTLTSTLLHDFVLDVETGDGNDVFTANLNADTNTDPGDFEFVDLDIEVRGGGGNDNLRVNADRDNNPFGFRVRFPTFVTVGLRGESGRDALRFDYGGDLLGGIFARLIGGDDDDGVTINANLENGSDGTFFARAEGNFGSDTLALLVTDNSGDGDAAVDALIDGGVGASIFFPVGGDNDRGTRTANVRSQFLESDSVITSPQFPQRSVTPKARAGEAVTLRGLIVEPDPGDTFFLDVDWGDGTPVQTFTFPPGAFVSGQTFAELTHVYAAKGKYDLTLVWRDQHGAYNFADDLDVHVLPAKKK